MELIDIICNKHRFPPITFLASPPFDLPPRIRKKLKVQLTSHWSKSSHQTPCSLYSSASVHLHAVIPRVFRLDGEGSSARKTHNIIAANTTTRRTQASLIHHKLCQRLERNNNLLLYLSITDIALGLLNHLQVPALISLPWMGELFSVIKRAFCAFLWFYLYYVK